MPLLENLTKQLTRDEGLRLKPYKDTQGKLTIGIGRNLSANGIRQREADYMLANDIDEACLELSHVMPWTDKLDEARLGVLLNMTFNLGIQGLIEFHEFLALVNSKQFEKAADEMLKSKWAEQVGPRAHRLSQQMRLGIWQ